MDMTMVTLENGMRAVVTKRQAAALGKPGASGFAGQLSRAAESAKQAEASGSADVTAAYDQLSADSKAVLSRLKVGAGDVTTDEWLALRKEMQNAGLITQSELFDSDPNLVTLGYMDEGGNLVSYPFAISCTATSCADLNRGHSNSLGDLDWSGNPFAYLKQWLTIVRNQRDNLDLLALAGGTQYDTSHLTRKIEAHEKVTGLVKSLMELV